MAARLSRSPVTIANWIRASRVRSVTTGRVGQPGYRIPVSEVKRVSDLLTPAQQVQTMTPPALDL